MLIISKHLVDRDLFETVELLTKERNQGWAPSQVSCFSCKQSLVAAAPKENGIALVAGKGEGPAQKPGIVVSRTGKMFHVSCWSGQ